MTDDASYDRRSVIKSGASALAVGSLAGCVGGADGGIGGSGDGTTTASTTASDSDEHVVEVGPDGNLTFEPAALEVEPGTTVTWVWKSNNHNVVSKDHPENADWQGTDGGDSKVYNQGHEYSHTFETPGTYGYYCTPHKAAGMNGEVVVSGSASATTEAAETEHETTEEADTEPETTEEDEAATTTEPATADDLPVRVGPNGELRFEPGTDEPLKIPAGTTVPFVWESDSHNIVVDSQPDGADWQGTPGAESKVYDEGYEYNHTFDVVGTYEFHCQPHESVGATGTIVVHGGTETTGN
ncbi:plastocyanin/azurin family copper-binding protein [Halorussus halophilus]|uniref:plastocyanin/azurin family copper-binding protein n=1 Tax=Halorussus halophilus TaxID=2650975 RepID=UPI00130162E3|nr:plastocyanin/azurin family copper-binding protein [Halorussus halophilus]